MEEKNINPNLEKAALMIGLDPKFWPYPIPKSFNMELLEIKEGYVKYKVVVKDTWLNPLKIMHGGIMVTLMDEAMGICCYTLNTGFRYATIDLNSTFFNPAREGETLFVYGKIEKSGKRHIHAVAHLENENGITIAKSMSNLLVFSKS
ncbi:MAG: PaaI family thioesterase [Chitinophagales bacterium]|nr:PaaI family thioesterase [Chitinophagales bacterium]